MESSSIINLLDLDAKMISKSEFYRFIIHEANLYLHPYNEWSIEFITDYLERKKIVNRAIWNYIRFSLIGSQDISSNSQIHTTTQGYFIWRFAHILDWGLKCTRLFARSKASSLSQPTMIFKYRKDGTHYSPLANSLN